MHSPLDHRFPRPDEGVWKEGQEKDSRLQGFAHGTQPILDLACLLPDLVQRTRIAGRFSTPLRSELIVHPQVIPGCSSYLRHCDTASMVSLRRRPEVGEDWVIGRIEGEGKRRRPDAIVSWQQGGEAPQEQ